MTVQSQISDYISSQPEAKRTDMLELHKIIQQLMPDPKYKGKV